ncbi:hypothetical protein ACR6C2_37915 [Streptomyces sp. INA 01156]
MWSARLPWSTEGVQDWGTDGDLVGPLARVLAAVPGGPEIVVAHSMSADVLLDLVDRESRRGGTPSPGSGSAAWCWSRRSTGAPPRSSTGTPSATTSTTST